MFYALVIIFGSMIIIAEIGVLSFLLSGNWIVSLLVTCAAALLVVFLSSLYFRDKPILARDIQMVCEIIFAIAFVNFFTCMFINLIIGGDALGGKIDGEHYYVGPHGYKEVPFIIYLYSLIHTYSLFITHPLAILAGWVHFATGGGNIGRLPHLEKMFSQKRNKSHHENQLPKSNY
jgi:hypothetical protein